MKKEYGLYNLTNVQYESTKSHFETLRDIFKEIHSEARNLYYKYNTKLVAVLILNNSIDESCAKDFFEDKEEIQIEFEADKVFKLYIVQEIAYASDNKFIDYITGNYWSKFNNYKDAKEYAVTASKACGAVLGMSTFTEEDLEVLESI